MRDSGCELVRDLIPDVAGDRAELGQRAVVEQHAVTCAQCRSELDLARLLLSSRYRVPTGLADRVERAVRFDRKAVRRPWWGLTAAAVAALALGIGITSQVTTGPPLEVPDYAQEVEEGELWLSDDGVIAGGPVLDGLSDEALDLLLDELLAGNGGAA